MTYFNFSVAEITVDRYAANPQLLAKVTAEETTGTAIHAMAVRAQVMIEPQRRVYDDDEAPQLLDQFGDRSRWKDTLKPFLWTFASTLVQGFTGTTEFELPIPCTYDFEVTAAKYLHALRGGEIPVLLLFSGTVFSKGSNGFAVERLSWDIEARHRLPVATWTELVDHFYPGTGWLRLDRETIAALARYKGEHGLTSWDEVMSRLLNSDSVTL